MTDNRGRDGGFRGGRKMEGKRGFGGRGDKRGDKPAYGAKKEFARGDRHAYGAKKDFAPGE